MSTDHGGEADRLAPVIPLFGAAEPPAPRTAERNAGLSAGRGDWHTTWTDDEPEGARAPGGASAVGGDGDAAAAERDEAERDEAERVLLRRLRGRSLSVREAQALVVEQGVDHDAAGEIVAAFVRRGYLDDARLAEQLLDGALGRKAQGASAIALTLTRRGIPREVVDAALATLPDDESERALEFARQKARGMRGLERDTALRRLHGQLARRGFAGGVALTAARTALDETTD